MNSEKVKEIKEKLKKQYYYLDQAYSDHLAYGGKGDDKQEEEIYFLRDVLTLINEFESENETFLKSKTMWKRLHTELCKENQELKDRIAELEKEIKENPSYAKGYADGIKNTYEAMLPQKLENFIKRLKEKDLSVPLHKDFMIIDNKAIDETLKEFLL